MINILTDSLPKTVEICGQKYPINSDFRAAVEFEILIQSKASPKKKTRGAIRIFFGANPPPYSEKELVEAIKTAAKSFINTANKPGIFYTSGLKYTVNTKGHVKLISFVDKKGKETPINIDNPRGNKY